MFKKLCLTAAMVAAAATSFAGDLVINGSARGSEGHRSLC